MKFTFCNLLSVAVLVLLGLKAPSIMQKIEDQKKFFEEVQIFTPDLEGLEMRRLSHLENDDKPYEILDPATGYLKETGWMKRDKGIIINGDAVKPDPSKNWLQRATNVRHLTLMFTFSKQKITIYRLFDIGVNQIVVGTHILKGKPNGDDPL